MEKNNKKNPPADNQNSDVDTQNQESKMGETQPAGETETNPNGEEGNKETEQEGGKDNQQPQNPGVDKRGKKTTTPKTQVSEVEKIAQKLFDSPEYKVLYFTSDVKAFGNLNDANRHASTLPNKIVKTIKKDQ